MDDFEDERSNDEFEIEFTDLPADENRSRAGVMLTKGVHILSLVRSRILAIKPRNDTIDQEQDESLEIEITDLPPDGEQPFLSKLRFPGSPISRQARLRRMFAFASTLLILCMLIFSALPPTRNTFSALFMRPTPTPAATSTATFSSWTTIEMVRELTPGVLIVDKKVINMSANATETVGIIIWDSSVLPGPPPEGKDCPARPTIGYSHQVGTTPMLAYGFTGPYATLHLYPAPVSVPAFPNTFGWTATILFEAPKDYPNPITLKAADIHSGSSLLFQLDSTRDPLPFLTLDPSQPTINQGNSADAPVVSWSVTLYFPAAGCYSLMASWPGGHWEINFSAGQ